MDADFDFFVFSGLLLRNDPIAHVFLPFAISEFPRDAFDIGLVVLGIWFLEKEKITWAEKHSPRDIAALPVFQSVFGKFGHALVGT